MKIINSFRFLLPVFLVWLFAIAKVNGQVDVLKVGSQTIDPESEGVFYSLPRTVVHIDLVVNKITNVKGPYAEFADKYLGLSQVISTNSVEYALSEIRISTSEEADPDEYYFVKLPEKSKSKQSLQLSLSQMGTLTGIKGTHEITAGGKEVKITKSSVELAELPSPNTFERIDTLVRRISVDTTMIEQRVFKKVTAAKTTDQKAKEAADFIMKLDESKFNLINGYQEVNYEKGTMEFMYNQMEKLMNDYLQMFKGITVVNSETYSYSFVPSAESIDNPVQLCRFSPGKGIMDRNSLGGDIIQAAITPTASLQEIGAEVKQRNGRDNSLARGLYYRLPEKVDISVLVGGKTSVSGSFNINQLGVVTFLPSGSAGNIEFYPATGSVKSISLH